MKKLITILLLNLFALASTSNVWVLVSFFIQQEYIAQNLCVNRFEPIRMCSGRCYLAAKMEQPKEKQQQLEIKEWAIKYVHIETLWDWATGSTTLHFAAAMPHTNKPHPANENCIFVGHKSRVFQPPRTAAA